MEIIPNLHFSGECEKAIDLYERALGAKRTVLLTYKDANPMDWQPSSDKDGELVYHAELMIGDQRIMLNDYTSDIPCGTNVSLLVLFDSVQETSRAYAVLKEGAQILAPNTETTYSSFFASLIDRYGVRWELMKEN